MKYNFNLKPKDFIWKYKKLVCHYCEKENYKYIGPKPGDGDLIKAEDFKGIGEVPDPKIDDEIVCFFCKESILRDKLVKVISF